MRKERNLNVAQSEEVANVSGRHTGKNFPKATKFCNLYPRVFIEIQL